MLSYYLAHTPYYFGPHSVADLPVFDTDPAPVFHFDADTDLTFHFTDLDRDPASCNAAGSESSSKCCESSILPYIGTGTLLSYCEPCMAFRISYASYGSSEPPQLRLLNLIWLLTLMWIRIRCFHLMRTRIRPLKIMPVHADPDPQHWVHP